jgi:2-methylcitrate dehydratase PrpD
MKIIPPQQSSVDEMSLSRRRLLVQAGWAAAAVAASPMRAVAAPAPSPLMTTLSTYMADAATRALPDAVIEQAKLHILDTIASAVSGVELGPAKAALAYAKDIVGDKTATIIATKLTASPLEAAFVNAMLAQSDETDDSNEFAQAHPGCSVVPSAWALGEKFGIDGGRLIRAATLGYDVGDRVSISLGGIVYRNTSHKSTHAIAGVFAAAAASGCVAGFDAQRMRWLLDYTAQQSAGIGAWARDIEHMEKSFVFAGMPAKNGLASALMVHAGFTGIDDIFSGTDNYFLAYGPNADQGAMTAELGTRFEIVRTGIKKWPAGTPIQAPLDAMENIFKKRKAGANDVKSVVVRMAPTEARVVDNRDIPDICLQHNVAVMLIEGTVSFKAAHDPTRMKDAEVLRQRAKVQLVPNDDLEKKLPEHQAIVEITFNDGTVLSDYVEHARGTAANLMDRTDVTKKSRNLMEPILGKAKTDHLIDQLLDLEKLKDIRTLRSLLQT